MISLDDVEQADGVTGLSAKVDDEQWGEDVVKFADNVEPTAVEVLEVQLSDDVGAVDSDAIAASCCLMLHAQFLLWMFRKDEPPLTLMQM